MFQPQQREPLTEFITCPLCCKVFNDTQQRPMSLSCGHTVCKACLYGRLGNGRCPFDQVPFPKDAEKLPSNYALMQLVEATSIKERSDEPGKGSEFDPKCYEAASHCIQEISVYLKPLAENTSDDEGSSSSSAADKTLVKCVLSRPLQRKVISLIQCQIIEDEGRARAARIARSIGERILCEILTTWQYPHQLSANLWAAVRARGCQFLGPAMQEEVLKLILLTLENGCMLSRKVLVLYVVGKLSSTYPHVSKTAIGHVVQLLYRASCFKVAKRDEESSLMQLKEEFREYEALRREHDAQIVQIAMEAGLRIPPEQWSSLLYGDMAHKSHMQSIMDKNPQSFSQCVLELVQVLQRNGDPGGFLKLRHRFEFLSCIDPNPEAQVPSLQDIKAIMQSLSMVMSAFVKFMSQPNSSRRCAHPDSQAVPNAQYKTSMCWDVTTKGYCPRGNACTFAHTQQELERHRQRSRRSMYKQGPKSDNAAVKQQMTNGVEAKLVGLNLENSRVMDTVMVPSSQAPTCGSNYQANIKDPNWAHTGQASKTTDHGPLAQKNGSGNSVGTPSSNMTQPEQSAANSTSLTLSQPAKEGPRKNFMPQTGFQTSFHPHNMRGPPPPIGHHQQQPHHPSSISPEGSNAPPRMLTPPSAMVNFQSKISSPQQNGPLHFHPLHGQALQGTAQPLQQHFTPTTTIAVVNNHQPPMGSYSNNFFSSPAVSSEASVVTTVSGGSQNSSTQHTAAGVKSEQSIEERQRLYFYGRKLGEEERPNIGHTSLEHDHVNVSLSPASATAYTMSMRVSNGYNVDYQNPHQQSHSAMRMATHSYGGPDGALHSLTNSHSSMKHPHDHRQLPLSPQTPVIPAVVADASTQAAVLTTYPPMEIAGYHQPHFHPFPVPHNHPLPAPLHPSAMISPYTPLVQYVPTFSSPHVQVQTVAAAAADNMVVISPDYGVVLDHPNEIVTIMPTEIPNNIADTLILNTNQVLSVIPMPKTIPEEGEVFISKERMTSPVEEGTISPVKFEDDGGHQKSSSSDDLVETH